MSLFRHESRYRYLPLVYVIWAVLVIALYYWYHPQYFICSSATVEECVAQYGWVLILKRMFIPSVAYFAYAIIVPYVALILWRERVAVTLRLSPLRILAGVFVFGFLALNLLVIFARIDNVLLKDLTVQIVTLEASILGKWGLVAFMLTAITLLGAAVGLRVFRWLQLEFRSLLEQLLFSVGLGWIILIYLLFGLLAFGLFTVLPVLLLTAVVAAVSWREIVWWVRASWERQFVVETPLAAPEVAALVLTAVIVGYTTLEILVPFPYLWDGLYRYVNTANLITTSGHFITGVFPYPYEILMAFGGMLSGTMMVAIALAWFAALCGAAVLYALVRRHATRAAGWLAVLGFVSMPVAYFIMGTMVKVDFAGLLYALLSVLAVLQWIAPSLNPSLLNGGRKRKDLWLVLAALFIGMAVTVKLTVALFGVGIAAAAGYWMVKKQKEGFGRMAGTVAVFIAVACVPLVPWIAKNIVEAGGGTSVHALLQGGRTGPDLGACSLSEERHYAPELSGGEREMFTARHEDIDRYWGYGPRSIITYLLLPWHITMNPTMNSWLTNVGPLMLVLLPLVLVLGFRRRPLLGWKNPHTALVGVAVTASYVAWMLFGEAIPWYAFPTFALYLVLAAWLCEERLGGKAWRTSVFVAVLMSVAVTVIFRMDTPAERSKYWYVSGAWTEHGLWYNEPPMHQELADIINADVPTESDPKYIYNAASIVLYRIRENDRRLYLDQMLDTMNCILDDAHDDASIAVSRFKERGFKYLLYNPDIEYLDRTPDRTLVAKVKRAALFLERAKNTGLLKEALSAIDQRDKFIAYTIQ